MAAPMGLAGYIARRQAEFKRGARAGGYKPP